MLTERIKMMILSVDARLSCPLAAATATGAGRPAYPGTRTRAGQTWIL